MLITLNQLSKVSAFCYSSVQHIAVRTFVYKGSVLSVIAGFASNRKAVPGLLLQC